MKNNIKGHSIFILAFLIVAFGLIYIFRGEIMSRFIPTVQQTGNIKILIKKDTAYISTKLIIKNHSFIKIEINRIKYSVELLHKTYLKSERTLAVELPKYGTDTIDFFLGVPYIAVLRGLKA